MDYLSTTHDTSVAAKHHTQSLEFSLTSDYIELNKLLKIYSLVESGWHAKKVITEWWVTVNGVVETRIRNKLKGWDVVQYLQNKIEVTSGMK